MLVFKLMGLGSGMGAPDPSVAGLGGVKSRGHVCDCMPDSGAWPRLAQIN